MAVTQRLLSLKKKKWPHYSRGTVELVLRIHSMRVESNVSRISARETRSRAGVLKMPSPCEVEKPRRYEASSDVGEVVARCRRHTSAIRRILRNLSPKSRVNRDTGNNDHRVRDESSMCEIYLRLRWTTGRGSQMKLSLRFLRWWRESTTAATSEKHIVYAMLSSVAG